MPVYVDDMFKYPLGQFRRMKMSHMIANTEAEAHAMAAIIGVDRKWWQGDHYDIAITKRTLAVQHGAIAITLRQCAAMCFMQKLGEPMGDPATAEDRMCDAMNYSKTGKPVYA